MARQLRAPSSPLLARLGLGTVQFGLNYGAFNRSGQPTRDEVIAILSQASASGIRTLDTAYLYGDSEEALGTCAASDSPFDIVTKTPHFKAFTCGADAASYLVDCFATSLRRLGQERVYGLLIHDADDLLGECGPALFSAMRHLRDEGRVDRIGVSVYTQAQIDALFGRFELDLVQLPINAFDQRLARNGVLARLKDAGVEVHARSIFLQGLLLADPLTLPAFFAPAEAPLRALRAAATAHGQTPLQAALGFVLGCPEIDIALVGVEGVSQLNDIVHAVNGLCQMNYADFAIDEQHILNPSNWPRKN